MTRTVAAFVGALLISAPSGADVIYTYSGNEFDTFWSATCPPVCSISGYFTTSAALPANASITNVTPLDFSFTDGFATINSANAITGTSFWIVTGPSGSITGWNNQYFSATNVMFSGTNPLGCLGCSVTDEGGGATYYARILDNPGTWTQTSSPVPEPSALLLLGGGVLAARGRLRWRRSSLGKRHAPRAHW